MGLQDLPHCETPGHPEPPRRLPNYQEPVMGLLVEHFQYPCFPQILQRSLESSFLPALAHGHRAAHEQDWGCAAEGPPETNILAGLSSLHNT